MTTANESDVYEIVIEGHLDEDWARWFDGFTVMHNDGGNTMLTGPVLDQAALRGILSRLWDLNLVLISVSRITQVH